MKLKGFFNFKLFTLTILLVFLPMGFNFSGGGAGTIYYVDVTGGADGNTGLSEGQAWQTINKVNTSSFNAGDSILFKCGKTWREQLIVPSSGDGTGQITFGAYGSGNKPIINGSDLVATWSDASPPANSWSATLTTEPYHVFFDGTKGTKESAEANLNAEFEWFWTANVLYVYSTTDPDTAYISPGIEAGARQRCIYGSAKDYITVNGIDLRYAGAINSNADNLDISNCDNWNIQNLTTKYGFQDGIAIHGGGDNNTVTSVTAHNNGNSTNEGNGIIVDGTGTDDGTIISCTSYSNQGDGITIHGPDGGTAIDGWTVSSCTCYNNGEQGIELYAASNCVVESNVCYTNGQVQAANGNGVNNAGTTDGATTRNVNNIIRYNLVYGPNGGSTGHGIANYYISGAQIYYNIVYDSDYHGISVLNNTVNNVTVYNNVVYNNQSRDAYRIKTIDSATIVTLKNNIVDTVHATYYGFNINTDSTSYTITDYNCADGIAANHYVNWGGSGYNLANYIANTNNGNNSIESDPLMTDPANGNFILQFGSPCINRGAHVGLSRDYAGAIVPRGGTVDIGAHEYLYAKGIIMDVIRSVLIMPIKRVIIK